MSIQKSDWKLFRDKIPEWQERHMERLNLEYIQLLNGPGNPSEKFWALSDRIREDKLHPGVIIKNMSRDKKNIIPVIAILLQDGTINEADIEDFSTEFKETVFAYRKNWL